MPNTIKLKKSRKARKNLRSSRKSRSNRRQNRKNNRKKSLNNILRIKGGMPQRDVLFLKDSIAPCGQHCGNTVRIFTRYAGLFSKFKCAICADWINYSAEPKVGFYTTCSSCEAHYKVSEVTDTPLCHVCKKEYEYDSVPGTPYESSDNNEGGA